MKKRYKRMKLMILCGIVSLSLITGCGKEKSNNVREESLHLSLKSVQNEANEFDYNGTILDLSKVDIRIPEVTEVYDISFDFMNRDTDEVEDLFLNDASVLIGVDKNKINLDHAVYVVNEWVEVNDEYENPMKEHRYSFSDVPDEIKSNMDSYISYNDGRYSMLLYQSSFMCEYSDNQIPKEITNDNNDYTDITWGYRALDLGTPYKTYYPLIDDISDVSYKMWDGIEYPLDEAISFAENYAKNQFKIGGSDVLDYYVYMVDVRKIEEDRYYYQMNICAAYKGVTLEYDNYYERDDNDYSYYQDSHHLCVFEKDNCSYMWSSCNSFDNARITNKYTEIIPLSAACKAIEKVFTQNKKLKVNSVELQYATKIRYITQEDDLQCGVGVDAHPVYHFVVKNPKILSYTTIMFDVDAIDGSVVVMYK